MGAIEGVAEDKKEKNREQGLSSIFSLTDADAFTDTGT